jgi:hypothetical protein
LVNRTADQDIWNDRHDVGHDQRFADVDPAQLNELIGSVYPYRGKNDLADRRFYREAPPGRRPAQRVRLLHGAACFGFGRLLVSSLGRWSFDWSRLFPS